MDTVMKNDLYILCTLLLVAAFLNGCTKDFIARNAVLSDRQLEVSVYSVNSKGGTKSLIDECNPDGMADGSNLVYACTPVADGGEGRTIGIWTDVIYAGGTYNNVFPNLQLLYTAGEHENNPDDDEISTPLKWNTDKIAFWYKEALHKFRAYYPYDIVNPKISAGSNADAMTIAYDINTMQDDILFAYNEENSSNNNYPHIGLDFKHALSAIKFKFKYKKEFYPRPGDDTALYEDYLDSVYLINTTAADALASKAVLVSGTPADDNAIVWSNYEFTTDRMYVWCGDKTEAFRLWRTNNTDTDENNPKTNENRSVVTGYCESGSLVGNQFENNDGWIMAIPGCSLKNTKLCFSTADGSQGSAMLPEILKDYTNGYESSVLQPGYRYTFTVIFSKMETEIIISIKPWNVIDSDHEFDLNK